MQFPFFKKRCKRIKRLIMRKISHEDFVNDTENMDDYDGITVVMIVVAVVVDDNVVYMATIRNRILGKTSKYV